MVKRHHLLLVTLLLANAAAMEALPIFLDNMVPTWVQHTLWLIYLTKLTELTGCNCSIRHLSPSIWRVCEIVCLSIVNIDEERGEKRSD